MVAFYGCNTSIYTTYFHLEMVTHLPLGPVGRIGQVPKQEQVLEGCAQQGIQGKNKAAAIETVNRGFYRCVSPINYTGQGTPT